jgi:uncharacterized alpha-E superfamily protein
MLSRVASRIYWMSRQMERAENMARILGVTSNMVLFGNKETREQNLLAPLTITGTAEAYFERAKPLTFDALVQFLALDEDNPSSIYSCLRWARDNAHAVRWQITSEMWETLNATWLEMKDVKKGALAGGAGATQFFDWVKDRSHLFRGVTYGTILRGEAFHFSRLGTHLERADNTARILDVKYHIILPRLEDVGGALDYYQWTSLLRSVSGFETYRTLYRDQILPIRVAEMLVLERRMPRSLASCFDIITASMDGIEGSDRAAKRLASELHARLTNADIEEIFQSGLHEYLTEVLDDVNELGARIQHAYLGSL